VADTAVYVYGVSTGPLENLPAARGVEDAQVEAVAHGDLMAITSPVHKTRLAARDLRAHWRVLEQTFERATVLPVRFGTVMESEAAVRERLLEPNAQRLSALLEEMRGLVQLNVKGRYDEDALLRRIVEENPRIARLRERAASGGGQDPALQFELGQLVESAVAQHRQRDANLALALLQPAALAVRPEEVGHPSAFNLAFLVERAGETAFSERVTKLREQLGSHVEVRYLGPLPPFSFATADLSLGGAAWA
jgi:hypothetical protein